MLAPLTLSLMGLILSACVAPSALPIAVLTSPTISGTAPLAVSFDLSFSVHPRGLPMEYELDFGDGTEPLVGTQFGGAVQHVYTEPGTYEATLRVWDEAGRVDTDALLITANGQTRPIGTQVGNLAPDFTASTTDGGQVTLSDYRGQVVLLEFWGAWCPPCRRSMPHLHDLVTTYADQGLVGIIVSTDAVEQDAIDFLQTHGFTSFISVWEPGGRSANPIKLLYGITSYPTTFVLDRDGVIRWIVHPNELTGDLLASLL